MKKYLEKTKSLLVNGDDAKRAAEICTAAGIETKIMNPYERVSLLDLKRVLLNNNIDIDKAISILEKIERDKDLSLADSINSDSFKNHLIEETKSKFKDIIENKSYVLINNINLLDLLSFHNELTSNCNVSSTEFLSFREIEDVLSENRSIYTLKEFSSYKLNLLEQLIKGEKRIYVSNKNLKEDLLNHYLPYSIDLVSNTFYLFDDEKEDCVEKLNKLTEVVENSVNLEEVLNEIL